MDTDKYINKCRDPWGLKRIGENPRIVKLLEGAIGRVGKIIDIGGGYGFYANALSRMGNNVTVVDKSKKMIAEGRKLFPNIKFVNGDATKMRFPANSFNAAICMGTLIYIKNRDGFFSGVHRILKKKGLFFLYERDRHDILNMFVRIFKRTEKPVDDPRNFLVKGEIKKLAKKHGFSVIKISGSYRNFLIALLVKE